MLFQPFLWPSQKSHWIYDGDGQRLELVCTSSESSTSDENQVWSTPEVTKEHAIRSFHSAKLSVSAKGMIESIVTKILGFEQVAKSGQVSLYAIPDSSRASYLEIEEAPDEPAVYNAAGTVHHIAFHVKNTQELLQKRNELLRAGLYPTEIIDRYYFKSIYFRTPAGILFELATNGPGFTVDEPEAELGQKLCLPPFLEAQRNEIEANLEPI